MTGKQPVILVVGTGLSASMAAAILAHGLRGTAARILVLEPPSPPRLASSVESSHPRLVQLHQRLGVSEKELMQHTAATFKLGTLYEGWSEPTHRFMHAHGAYGADVGKVRFHQSAVKLRQVGDHTVFDRYSLAAVAGLAGRFAHPSPDPRSVRSTLDYGLHLDAQRYSDYLKYLAVENGVQPLADEVAQVLLSGDGFVQAVVFDSGHRLNVDLVVDCSPAGVVASTLEPVDWLDWQRGLPVDRVLSTSISGDETIPPYTLLRPAYAGWIRKVPLRAEVVIQYFYDSHFCDETSAREYLKRYLGDHAVDEPRLNTVKVGRKETFWVGNCVTIGNAGVNPAVLGVDTSYLLQLACEKLLELLPNGEASFAAAKEYNRYMGEACDRVRDLHIAHMTRAGTYSPYWTEVATSTIPDELAHKLAVFASRGRIPFYEEEPLSAEEWAAFLLGHNLWPSRCDPLADTVPLDDLRRLHERVASAISWGADTMPKHSEYLLQYCGPD